MSLYTPVFPPLNAPDSSYREAGSVPPSGKQQHYVKHLRDLHLFLSTQSGVLSPPSRPNSPSFDYRVQKVKDQVNDIFNTTGESWNAKWTRTSQVLKLGCMRGRYWSVSQSGPCTPEHGVDWILPDQEFEWIDWEKKREESRRLKARTNASQHIGSAVPATLGSQHPSHASFVGPSRSCDIATARHLCPPGVSPKTLRIAKEKVKKWQASMTPEVWDDTTRGSLSTSSGVMAAAEGARETARPQRSHTLDFAVVKPVANSFVGKKRKGRGSVPVPSRNLNSPKPSKLVQDAVLDTMVFKGGVETPPVKDAMPKIATVAETPYLPPSFPVNLETSTPLSSSKIVVRTKPSPILPAMLSTPPPSTPANPPDDPQPVLAEPRVTVVSSSLPPRVDAVHPEKRSRTSATPVNGVDPPVTPLTKRLRMLSQDDSLSASTRPTPANEDLNPVPYTRNDAPNPSLGAAPSHHIDSLEAAPGIPLTPTKADQPTTSTDGQEVPEKVPSPTKSVRSFFSAPDSDPADSPMKANLLLGSPVSPMLSYARNSSVFLPQITSTQVRGGSPTAIRANNEAFGKGFSSQFDVETHVDRVSEMLEKDVDIDGWLRDARTLEMS